MSNIRPGGKLISEVKDHKLIYYKETNKVVGWTRMIFDGQRTNAWEATNGHTPEHAVRAHPHLKQKILDVSQAD